MLARLREGRPIPQSVFLYGLLLLFLLSGFAGLVYQSIWSHYLGLLLGHAAYAQALVLATFMGGMALGALVVSRYGTRWRNLIRGYAVVEIALGVAGVAFHVLFVFTHGQVLESLLPRFSEGAFAGDLAKWAVGIGLILPQTVLLGASFPLMSAGIMRRVQGADGRVLGTLYFTNSMGAALGALASAFILLPLAGLPGAVQFAGWLNLMIGLAAWLLGSDPAGAGARPRQPQSLPQRPMSAAVGREQLLLALLLITALSSAASFVYEIGWIRMLSLAVGTTLHAFELMLAAFIGGLALGGFWIRGRADRLVRPLLTLGWIQLGMGPLALLSLGIYAQGAFQWVGWLVDALAPNDAGYALYHLGTASAAIVLMLPAAFLAGATLPLITAILLRAGHGEAVIGRVYAANTLGAIVGILLAIHLLLPALGLRNAMMMAAGLDLLLGLAILRLHGETIVRRWPLRVGALVLVSSLVATPLLVSFDPYRLASGVYRDGQAELPLGTQMRYYRDGKTASIALYDAPGGIRAITYNGKVDAGLSLVAESPSSDEPTMVLAAALPLAMLEAPRRAAVIGLGSGLTSHTLLADERLERVDTIEIEAAMAEAARGFGQRVDRVWEDPRSRLVIDDAKAVLSGQSGPWDIIVSEPSNPWMAGVGTLFADEFYAFVRERLTSDGLFVQWIQLYEIDEELVGSILAALMPHFGEVQAWMSNNADLLLVATPAERLPNTTDESRLFRGALGQELELAGLQDPAQLRLREAADDRLLRALDRVLAQPPNSWYRPVLMLEAPRTRYRNDNADRLIQLGSIRTLPMELLGIGAPLPLDVEPTLHQHFQSESETHNARALRDLWRGRTLPGDLPLSAGVVRDAELLRLWSKDCAGLFDPGRVPAWLDTWGRLTARYLPLLDETAARGAFLDPVWMDCEELPGGIHRALELVDALAARDLETIPGAAARYLETAGQPDLADSALHELAYLSGQAALLAQADDAAAQAFQFRYLGNVSLSAQGRFTQAILEQYRIHGGS